MQEQRQKGGRVGCDPFPYPAVAILFTRPSSLVLSSGDFILHAIPKLRHTTTSCSVGRLVFFFLLLSRQPSFFSFWFKGYSALVAIFVRLGASHLTRRRKAVSFAEARAIRTLSTESLGPPFERKPTAQKSFSCHVLNIEKFFCENGLFPSFFFLY